MRPSVHRCLTLFSSAINIFKLCGDDWSFSVVIRIILDETSGTPLSEREVESDFINGFYLVHDKNRICKIF